MCGAAAVFTVKLCFFDQFFNPLKILSDDDSAQMVFIVAVFSTLTVMDVFFTHRAASLYFLAKLIFKQMIKHISVASTAKKTVFN
jgi:hypothetical protein